MVYAVIDTNVLVSALFSAHPDSSTVIIRNKIADGEIIPLFNAEIIDEYRVVLSRPKFHFPDELVDAVLAMVLETGISLDRTMSDEVFPDPKDIVFYEVALSKEGSYLVTGNTKHFPKTPIVVTPAEMLEILKKKQP
ncbi:MAG: putative toxin-antitoxin system toxin component, PIN family [Bacteroidales bacterium]|nr:putative toxin-antitoxin system toxin component, PIN family [Bacteroidales bacterium]